MWKMTYDIHTHTTFSHGKGSMEDNVKATIEKGLSAVAISDHGPGHINYGFTKTDIPVMRKEVERLNEKYPQIKTYLSVEANIINKGNNLDVSPKDSKLFDFIIAGYHYGVENGYCLANAAYSIGIGKKKKDTLIRRNTRMIINAIEKNDIKVLTHPGDKAPVDMDAIAKACEKNNVLMEISTHHSHLTSEEIKICMKYDVEFIISSDAHIPKKVGSFEEGIKKAETAGLDLSRIVNIREV